MSGEYWLDILRDTVREWTADKVPRLGAALAYYAIFSIVPFVLIAIGIASLVFGKKAARGEIVCSDGYLIAARSATRNESDWLRHENLGRCGCRPSSICNWSGDND